MVLSTCALKLKSTQESLAFSLLLSAPLRLFDILNFILETTQFARSLIATRRSEPESVMSASAMMPSCRNNIAALPLELLDCVLDYLNLHDFVSLKFVCKGIYQILTSDAINEKVCKVRSPITRRTLSALDLTDFGQQKSIFYSREARLATQGLISYAEAVQNTHLRRKAFATARPFSVLVLGSGASYIYRNGA